jgi:hypothetical protein
MPDISTNFDQITVAHQSGNFLSYFGASGYAATVVQRHPLGFRVARLASEGITTLRLHIWPKFSQPAQPDFEIHDHNFCLKSYVLFGELQQTVYDITDSSAANYSIYDINYDTSGSILTKSKGTVTPTVSERTIIRAGDTYELGAGVFHRLDLDRSMCAATLVLTTQVGGIPRTLGPGDGPATAHFERSNYAGTVMDELVQNFGKATSA